MVLARENVITLNKTEEDTQINRSTSLKISRINKNNTSQRKHVPNVGRYIVQNVQLKMQIATYANVEVILRKCVSKKDNNKTINIPKVIINASRSSNSNHKEVQQDSSSK